jgi:hypothetical protein
MTLEGIAIRGLVLVLAGCAAQDGADDGDAADSGGDDGDATTGGTTGGDDGTPAQCGDTSDAEPIYPPPGECYNNAGCATCNCVAFQDNPPDPQAVCAEPGAAGELRVTATLFEFPGRTVVPEQTVKLFNAFDVGIYGIDMATPQAETVADAQGRIDVTITPMDQIGMVAIVEAEGFRATATGLAKPPYEPANAIHDLFLVRESDLVAWSTELAAEPELAEWLPLGDKGGVVGVVRNRYTGEPMAGLRIVSKTNGAATTALVRYLGEDGTFDASETSPTGVYVLLNPALAEEFEAELAGGPSGEIASTRANKAGSGAPGVFTMNLTIDTDPGANPFE